MNPDQKMKMGSEPKLANFLHSIHLKWYV